MNPANYEDNDKRHWKTIYEKETSKMDDCKLTTDISWPKPPKQQVLDILYKRLEECDASEISVIVSAIVEASRIQDFIPYLSPNYSTPWYTSIFNTQPKSEPISKCCCCDE